MTTRMTRMQGSTNLQSENQDSNLIAGLKRKNEVEAASVKPTKRAALGEISTNAAAAANGKATLKKSMKKSITNIVSKVISLYIICLYITLHILTDHFVKLSLEKGEYFGKNDNIW